MWVWGCGRSPGVARLASAPLMSICSGPKPPRSRGRLDRNGTMTAWAALFGGPPRSRPAVLPMPDFADLHRQRQQHAHLTQQLLWEEYRQANPNGYQYSRFCELYQRWRRKQDVVLRQEHKAGEKLFVDWAGTTIPIHDPRGGPAQQAHLFVAVLGASSYTYAEATAGEQLASWIGAHVRAFEFYKG